MSQADISQFLSHFPSYPLTTLLKTVARATQVSTMPPPSHIVVVDTQQFPLGALAVGRLWAYAEETRSTPQAEVSVATPPDDGRLASEGARCHTPVAEPELSHCQPWLEPVRLIPVQASLSELWAIIQAHPQALWVVINAQQQYQGVIEASTLVPWLLQRFPPPSEQTPATEPTPSSPIPLPPTSAQERTWVMAVGHALNTPLTSLLGLSTLLLDQRIGPLTERQTRYAWLIQQSIRRLTRMINQLVDWIRLDANQIVLGLAPVDLQPFLETLLPTFQASWLAEPDLSPDWMQSFTVTLNPELITLLADRPRLLQSLHGVLNYLLHQGAIPGGITLDWWGTSWVGITLWAASPSPEALPAYPWREPYPPSTNTDALEGLGLALARRLCQCHGGDLVGFWSAVYGYQMTLLLPLKNEAARGSDTPSPTTLVLLLSTASGLVDQVYGQLQPQGYRLVVAGNWPEAVALTRRLAPAIVLLHDHALATVSALALAELAPPLAPIPPIVVIGGPPNRAIAAQTIELSTDALSHDLLPTLAQLRSKAAGGASLSPITLLLLRYRHPPSPEPSGYGLSSQWQDELQRHGCRLLQADDPSQANLLCRVWQPQAIVLDHHASVTQAEVDHLTQFPALTQIPIITHCPFYPELSGQLHLVDGSTLFTYPSAQGVVALIQTIQAAQGLPGQGQ